jgi:hypothetical protein
MGYPLYVHAVNIGLAANVRLQTDIEALEKYGQ